MVLHSALSELLRANGRTARLRALRHLVTCFALGGFLAIVCTELIVADISGMTGVIGGVVLAIIAAVKLA